MKKIMRFIVCVELIVLIIMGAIYFYPPSYVLGVWLLENNRPPFKRTLQGAQMTVKLKKNINMMEAKCYVLKNDPLGYTLWNSPRGLYWFPTGNPGIVHYLLGQQETHVYGYNKTISVLPGDIVLDCGAHIGVFTYEALRLGAKLVVAIEPAKDNIECLRRNFKKEIEEGRVIICPKGVWDKEGTLPFYTNPQSSAGDSFVYHNCRSTPSYFAPLTTIDQITKELNLPHVDFIKMDIKGAVVRALIGGKKTINTFEPRLVLSTEEEGIPQREIIKTVQNIRPDYNIHYSTLSIKDHSTFFNELIFTK